DKYNDIAGFDTRWRLNKKTTFTAQALGSVSHRPFFFADEGVRDDRKERGLAYAYDLNTSGRNWGYEYAGVGRSQFFRADLGYNRVFESEFGPSREGFARLNAGNSLLRGLSAPPCLTLTADPLLDSEVQSQLSPCTFFGTDPERSSWNSGWYFFAGTTPSKKY